MQWLLYLFAAYLIACYLWGMYLVVRLYTGKRLSVLLFGSRHAASTPPASTVEDLRPAYADVTPQTESAPRKAAA